MTFASLFDSVRPAYEIPDDDLVGEIITPAFCAADIVRLEAGFFTSRCLAQVAVGLAAFINNSEATLDLMVSPEISEEDQEAIRRGIREPQAVLDEALERLFAQARLSDSAVQQHTVETLAYLVASNRLRMRVVLMERGMYHKKIWLFRAGAGAEWLAVHGSGNATERGLLVNGEQMSIDRAWVDGPQAERRVRLFIEQWEHRWENRHKFSLTVEVSQALDILRSYASQTPPTISDFWKAWRHDHEAGLEPELPPAMCRAPIQFHIPPDLLWREGQYAHQGRAVEALLRQDIGGLVSIATGGGKTYVALITATEIQNTAPRHICVVLLVPSRPLIRQWMKDIRGFGIDPVVLSGISPIDRLAELERIELAFATEQPRTEVLIMSNNLFTRANSPERHWLSTLAEKNVELIMIADEVHNLGTRSFIDDPPVFFARRIGLSATPIRQYDPDGTDKLFDYFGGPAVFEFSLGDAIEAGCLVPYRYYLHEVALTGDEMEHYEELTAELVRAGFRIDGVDDGATVALNPRVERLLQKRRALIEQADAKLPALETELRRMGSDSVAKTLIYTSAKPTVLGKPRQITAVNSILERLHIISHQYTSEETGTADSQCILERFGSGEYQVLTAMKVLDEGVDIPQTDTAFLLASSTVQREWVQRRGRILRQAPNKKMAYLHDFLVVPPDVDTSVGQSLLKSELKRAAEFANLAENEFDADGPNKLIQDLEERIWRNANV